MVQPIVRPRVSLPSPPSTHATSLPPQNVIFKHLQAGTRVSIWLFDNTEQRIEGKIIVRRPRVREWDWAGRVS